MIRLGRRGSFSGGIVALVALLWLVGVGSVSAHAVPEVAYPPIDQAVPVMPSTIEVWFSEEVKPEGTTLEVLKLDGTKVDLGNTTLDLQDPNRSHVTVGVHPGLDNGVYVVQWTSLSALDGDSVSGSYQFTVDPTASPQALPQVEAQQAPAQEPAVDGTAEEESSGRDPLLFGAIATIAILGLLGLLLFWFLRRPARGRRWRDDVVDRF